MGLGEANLLKTTHMYTGVQQYALELCALELFWSNLFRASSIFPQSIPAAIGEKEDKKLIENYFINWIDGFCRVIFKEKIKKNI